MTDLPPRTGVTVRAARQESWQEYFDLDQWAFAQNEDGLDPAPFVEMLPWDRAYSAHLDDAQAMAGIYASFPFELTVPSGDEDPRTVPCAGLTWVGVHPENRRRGVLRAMLEHHFVDVRARREPVGALFAAEPGIYGRFGYGIAARAVRLTLGRGAELREVPGTQGLRFRLETADVERHSDVVHAVYDQARLQRPGGMTRTSRGLRRVLFDDQPPHRRDMEPLRFAVAEDVQTGQVRGYALFRRKSDWSDGLPNGQVWVRELTALDPAAARLLWARLADLDLMAKLGTDDRPLDDPLLSLLVDARASTPRVTDNLWIRLLDVPVALGARRFARELDVVLEVTDELVPANAGRWRLRGGPLAATCTPSTDPADLVLDVRELGGAYLGGTTLAQLAGAGLVGAQSPRTLRATSEAFASPVAPLCGFMF